MSFVVLNYLKVGSVEQEVSFLIKEVNLFRRNWGSIQMWNRNHSLFRENSSRIILENYLLYPVKKSHFWGTARRGIMKYTLDVRAFCITLFSFIQIQVPENNYFHHIELSSLRVDFFMAQSPCITVLSLSAISCGTFKSDKNTKVTNSKTFWIHFLYF